LPDRLDGDLHVLVFRIRLDLVVNLRRIQAVRGVLIINGLLFLAFSDWVKNEKRPVPRSAKSLKAAEARIPAAKLKKISEEITSLCREEMNERRFFGMRR